MTADRPVGAAPRHRSKAVATWLAVLGGAFGLHALYVHGTRPRVEWLLAPLALAGLAGVVRMRNLGVDDQVSWLLIPMLGIAISIAMLTAIVYGLMPDDKWNARHNAGGREARTGWPTVLGVVTALLIGGGVLMATVAFTAEHYFRYAIETTPR